MKASEVGRALEVPPQGREVVTVTSHEPVANHIEIPTQPNNGEGHVEC